jgi:hypothetical protein
LLATASPAIAEPVVDPIPIGPNQAFVGVVNGSRVEGRIAVRCFAPTGAEPNTGNPIAGQTVAVENVFTTESDAVVGPPLPVLGFTGSAGRVVGVNFGTSDLTKPPVVIRAYNVAVPIPTDIVVPCRGSGVVRFDPLPTSPTARPGAVKVTFVPVS